MDIGLIRAAGARIGPHVRHTPMLTSPMLDAIAGRRVLVKAECLQHTGSFKARGGWAAVSALSAAERAAGVVAVSSGNHAQGVARAAAALGVACTIVMPADAPKAKIDATRALGATVVTYDRETGDREAIAADIAAPRGRRIIHPFDDAQVVAGQGTAGLEIAADTAALGVSRADVLVCCGGGGLTAGIALALAADAPGLRARPVEPEGFDDTALSLRARRIVRNLRRSGSLCDAILTPAPGRLTFPIMQRLCGPGLAVTDAEAMEAMALAFHHLRIVLEPGGAVALAAALFRGDAVAGDAVIAVASGGNVDPALLARALRADG